LLGFFKRRKREAAKREAIEIGSKIVGQANEAIAKWRAEMMESRREMLAASFDERLVSIEPEDGLSFKEIAEIEALALLKNWHERKNEYAKEATGYLDNDTMEGIDIIGIGEEFTAFIYKTIDEVGRSLADDIERAMAEACARHEKKGHG